MTILVVQTAFLGDVVLTTPLIDALAASGSTLDVIVTPAGAQALAGHRSVRSLITYDKKGASRGFGPFLTLVKSLRRARYDVAVVPHRSARSALLAFLARIPRRIGFDRSALRWIMTDVVRYRNDAHEIDRNLDLLEPLGMPLPTNARPSLSISTQDEIGAGELLVSSGLVERQFVAVAPGSVWTTKRWPEERYAALIAALHTVGIRIVLIGGREDVELCRRIRTVSGIGDVIDLSGQTSVLRSAAVIRSASVLVTNDSAPLHLGAAVGTPIVAIFGATSPSFGFGPRGPRDLVLETMGLSCRPCAIHGSAKCPIGTFECMLRIDVSAVRDAVMERLATGR